MNRFKTNDQIEIALKEWSLELNKLTMEQLENGFNGMMASGDKYPPSLPQFISYCKGQVDGLRQDTGAYKLFKSYEEPRSSKETGKEAFDNMKRLYLGRGE